MWLSLDSIFSGMIALLLWVVESVFSWNTLLYTIPCTRLERTWNQNSFFLRPQPTKIYLANNNKCRILFYSQWPAGERSIRSNQGTLLMAQLNSLVFVTGDFNPTATGLHLKDFTQPNNLKQMVSLKTRDWYSWLGPQKQAVYIFNVHNHQRL